MQIVYSYTILPSILHVNCDSCTQYKYGVRACYVTVCDGGLAFKAVNSFILITA